MGGRVFALSGRHFANASSKSVRQARCNATASSASSSANPQKAMNPYFAAALTSGTLLSCSDIVSQAIESKIGKKQADGFQWNPRRTARMGSCGLLLLGPGMKWWYGTLAQRFPGAGLKNFAIKMGLNQAVFGPTMLSTVLTWNMTLTGHAKELPAKMQADFLPTMIHGWEFWVPASTVNFLLIPLSYQVFFMSTCSFMWNTYLSYVANKAK